MNPSQQNDSSIVIHLLACAAIVGALAIPTFRSCSKKSNPPIAVGASTVPSQQAAATQKQAGTIKNVNKQIAEIKNMLDAKQNQSRQLQEGVDRLQKDEAQLSQIKEDVQGKQQRYSDAGDSAQVLQLQSKLESVEKQTDGVREKRRQKQVALEKARSEEEALRNQLMSLEAQARAMRPSSGVTTGR